MDLKETASWWLQNLTKSEDETNYSVRAIFTIDSTQFCLQVLTHQYFEEFEKYIMDYSRVNEKG